MNHPVDVDYIRKMVPNISDDVVEKQKTLQSGTCLGFGSAFKIPLIVKLKMPDPMPKSGNCDVVSIWNGNINISHTPSVSVQTQPVVEETKQSFITPQNVKETDNKLATSTSSIAMPETSQPVTQPIVEEVRPSFITPHNIEEGSKNISIEQPQPSINQESNVINFGISSNNQPITPMPATDTISPIPEVMPGDNNGNTPPTFM